MEKTYQNLFAGAIERTLKFSMDLPNEDLRQLGSERKRFAILDNIQGAFTHVYKSVGGFTSEDIKGNCIKYGMLSKPLFEEYLNTKGVLTVGYVIDNGDELFKFGDGEISRFINKMPERNRKVKVHVWLTLPSFEIIDLTYMETKRNIKGAPFTKESGFKYVFDTIENLYLKQRLAYHPMLVGEDSLFKMGLVLELNNEVEA